MLKEMTKEQLEVLSYADLAEIILKESTKSLNTPTIFRTICDLLEFSDSEYTDKIGDFYTSLSTDKRFVFLDNNEWDLREKHPVDIVLEEDDEDDEETEDEDITEIEEEPLDAQEEDIDSVIEDDLDDTDDDLDDLSILSEDEMED